jgi:hypothetical protein
MPVMPVSTTNHIYHPQPTHKRHTSALNHSTTTKHNIKGTLKYLHAGKNSSNIDISKYQNIKFHINDKEVSLPSKNNNHFSYA